MYKIFKGNYPNDIETAAETIIPYSLMLNKNINSFKTINSQNITDQLLSEDSFESYLEKRNKEH